MCDIALQSQYWSLVLSARNIIPSFFSLSPVGYMISIPALLSYNNSTLSIVCQNIKHLSINTSLVDHWMCLVMNNIKLGKHLEVYWAITHIYAVASPIHKRIWLDKYSQTRTSKSFYCHDDKLDRLQNRISGHGHSSFLCYSLPYSLCDLLCLFNDRWQIHWHYIVSILYSYLFVLYQQSIVQC